MALQKAQESSSPLQPGKVETRQTPRNVRSELSREQRDSLTPSAGTIKYDEMKINFRAELQMRKQRLGRNKPRTILGRA